jgi:hypothetical protein
MYTNPKRPHTGSLDSALSKSDLDALLPSESDSARPLNSDSSDAAADDSDSWSRKWEMIHERMRVLKKSDIIATQKYQHIPCGQKGKGFVLILTI